MNIELKNNDNINFSYSESAKCWMGTGLINSIKVDFEIYRERYIQPNIDWAYFQDFVFNLEKNDSLPDLIKKSQTVLLSLADAFGASIEDDENIEDFKMDFAGLSFQGKSESHFTKGYAYSLWFNIVSKKNINAYVDPYGVYIVDVETRFIVGAKREQC